MQMERIDIYRELVFPNHYREGGSDRIQLSFVVFSYDHPNDRISVSETVCMRSSRYQHQQLISTCNLAEILSFLFWFNFYICIFRLSIDVDKFTSQLTASWCDQLLTDSKLLYLISAATHAPRPRNVHRKLATISYSNNQNKTFFRHPAIFFYTMCLMFVEGIHNWNQVFQLQRLRSLIYWSFGVSVTLSAKYFDTFIQQIEKN